MKHRLWAILAAVLALSAPFLQAHEVGRVMAIRGGFRNSVPTLGLHPNGSLYFDVLGRGLYRLDTTDFSVHFLTGSDHSDYLYIGSILGGRSSTLAFTYTGDQGVACMIVDSTGTLHHHPGWYTDRGGDIFATPGVNAAAVTVNAGASWIPAPHALTTSAIAPFGLALFLDPGKPTLMAAHRSSPDAVVATAIATHAQSPALIGYLHVSAYGQDSIMWFREGRDRADTLCRARLGDTTCICDTLVGGRSADVLFIQEDRSGNVLYADKAGNVARYRSGTWQWQQGQLPVTSFTNYVGRSISHVLLGTTGSNTAIHIPFDPEEATVVDSLPFEAYPSASLGSYGYTSATNGGSGPSASGGSGVWRRSPSVYVNLASIISRSDSFIPMLAFHGTTRTDGTPLAVLQDDALCVPIVHGLAHVLDVPVHMRMFSSTERFQGEFARCGLLPACTTPTGILFPGRGVSLHDRNGMRIRTSMQDITTTSIHVTPAADTLVGTAEARLMVYRTNGSRDTTDLRSVLCPGPEGPRGYVSHMHAFDASTWLVAVSGRQIFDDTLFEAVPYACGGILRTTDAGATWSIVELPAPVTYMISMATSAQGTLIVTATDAILRSDLFNATFDGRYVFRSSDKGRSWTTVHEQACNLPLRIVGGYGVATGDGTLLIPGTDELLESTDDGLTWNVRTMEYIGEPISSSRVVSVFRHEDGGPVYYCTEQGLYKGTTTTSAEERIDEAAAAAFTIQVTPNIVRSSFDLHVTYTTPTERIESIVVAGILGNIVADMGPGIAGSAIQHTTISAQDWPSGIYYVVVRTARSTRTVPVIKVD